MTLKPNPFRSSQLIADCSMLYLRLFFLSVWFIPTLSEFGTSGVNLAFAHNNVALIKRKENALRSCQFFHQRFHVTSCNTHRKNSHGLWNYTNRDLKPSKLREDKQRVVLLKRTALEADAGKLWKLLPDRIIKNYRVTSEIGRGGYGCVVLAEANEKKGSPQQFPQKLAIKLCRPQRGAIPVMLREGLAMQRLSSSSIVKCYDLGCNGRDGGVVWFAMEHLEGRNLQDLIVERGPFSSAEVCRVGIDILSALEQVHAAGLIHRDVKPQNIIRVRSFSGSAPWKYKIVDFGATTTVVGQNRIVSPALIAERQEFPGATPSGTAVGNAEDVLATTFASLDIDADGLLGAEDIRVAMQNMGLKEDTQHVSDMLTRHGGMIDEKKFGSMYAEIASLPLSSAALTSQRNHSKSIPGVDFHDDIEPAAAALAGAFIALDADGDGSVDLKELEACFAPNAVASAAGLAIPRPGRLESLLAKYDADGDGKCSPQEFARMYGELAALQDSMASAGTHGYMSPEAYRDGPFTPASDVWSLGATLFRLAAGSLPFTVLGATWGRGLVGDGALEAPDLRSLAPTADAELAAVLARALRKDPAQRFRTAADMRSALLLLTPGH